MRSLLLTLILAATSSALGAQRSRVEVTKPTTPHDDSKANSDKVPGVYAISGQFERIVVLRFKYQADLLAGIEKMELLRVAVRNELHASIQQHTRISRMARLRRETRRLSDSRNDAEANAYGRLQSD